MDKKKSTADAHNMSGATYGMWYDEVYRKDANGEPVLVERTDINKNLITTDFRRLVAGLMLNEGSFTGGVLQHAMGRGGGAAWDISLPSPSFGEVQLTDEFFRKTPDAIVYLKDVTGTADSGTVTTLVDAARTEPDCTFDGFVLKVTAGTNSGLQRTVVTYTVGNFVFSTAFPDPIDATSVYIIEDVPTGTITNKIQIQTLLDFADANGEDIREQGLFGGDATGSVNSGFMIDKINHPRRFKDSSIQIRRFINLLFT